MWPRAERISGGRTAGEPAWLLGWARSSLSSPPGLLSPQAVSPLVAWARPSGALPLSRAFLHFLTVLRTPQQWCQLSSRQGTLLVTEPPQGLACTRGTMNTL